MLYANSVSYALSMTNIYICHPKDIAYSLKIVIKIYYQLLQNSLPRAWTHTHGISSRWSNGPLDSFPNLEDKKQRFLLLHRGVRDHTRAMKGSSHPCSSRVHRKLQLKIHDQVINLGDKRFARLQPKAQDSIEPPQFFEDAIENLQDGVQFKDSPSRIIVHSDGPTAFYALLLNEDLVKKQRKILEYCQKRSRLKRKLGAVKMEVVITRRQSQLHKSVDCREKQQQ